MNINIDNFGPNCKKYREAARISQRVLADFCQTHQNLICRYENGVRYPTLYSAIRIANALQVGLDDLVAETTITK